MKVMHFRLRLNLSVIFSINQTWFGLNPGNIDDVSWVIRVEHIPDNVESDKVIKLLSGKIDLANPKCILNYGDLLYLNELNSIDSLSYVNLEGPFMLIRPDRMPFYASDRKRPLDSISQSTISENISSDGFGTIDNKSIFKEITVASFEFSKSAIAACKYIWAEISKLISAGIKHRSFRKPDISFSLLLFGRNSTTAG